MGQADEQHAGQKQGGKGRMRRAWRRGDGSPRMRSVVVAAGIIGVVAAPMGVAATGQGLREGVRNGTATKETQIIGNFGATTGLTGGYVTRQSNLSTSGGGAVYGCRSGAGGSSVNPPQNPCVRANNLARGFAFEFNATSGDVVGTINSSTGGDTKKPFTTNATGVATGLNADRVDGLDAAQIAGAATAAAATDAQNRANSARSRWVVVNAAGEIESQSGGFRVVSAYGSNGAPAGAAGNVYIDAGEDLNNNGIAATLGLNNAVDVDGGGMAGRTPGPDANAEFSGEVVASRCAITGIVGCAPPGANEPDTFVVSPRLSDGQVTENATRKRFQVVITG